MENKISFLIGDKSYELPEELKEVYKLLKKTETFINSSDNLNEIDDFFEENSAKKPSIKVLQNVTDFLVRYFTYIFIKYHKVIELPYITPSDDTLDIDWDTETFCFLINVAEDKSAEYYSSNKKGEHKGKFNTSSFDINKIPMDFIPQNSLKRKNMDPEAKKEIKNIVTQLYDLKDRLENIKIKELGETTDSSNPDDSSEMNDIIDMSAHDLDNVCDNLNFFI